MAHPDRAVGLTGRSESRSYISWRFDPSLGEERISALSNAPTVDFLNGRIPREMVEIVWGHHHEADDNTGFWRVVYCIRVSEPLFDLFFNSESGYRGSYYSSPDIGLNANAHFMQSMSPKLLEWTTQNSSKILDVHFAAESLKKRSAKAGLAEVGKDMCSRCIGEWKHPQDPNAEILNGRWGHHEDTRGRKAPYLTKIRIFGAFLNERGDEWDPKPDRAHEIHDSGWT